ncbi:metal ABC transporter permease [Gemmatimonadota bacterium]
MSGFFQDMGMNPLLLTGLLAGILASFACGMVGPYVVTKRIVFLVGAIAHTAVGGIGAAIYLRYHYPSAFSGLEPFHGAVAAAILGAILIGVVHERVHERMDTLIGAMWAIGMATGILLVKYTPGYHVELMSYLFGNIAVVQWADVLRLLVMDIVIVGIVVVYYKRFLAVCLDEEYAKLQGVHTLRTNLVLLIMVALTVVSLMQIVGLILVIALLTLPAATAGHYVKRLGWMMVVATGLSIVLTTLPRMAVYGSGVSPESAIVLSAGAVYLGSVVFRRLRRV